MSAVQVFSTHCWEKEKMLKMSNCSFSHSVFYLFGELYAIFIKVEFLSANSCSLEESKICCLVKPFPNDKFQGLAVASMIFAHTGDIFSYF